jgi:hypothetical protein
VQAGGSGNKEIEMEHLYQVTGEFLVNGDPERPVLKRGEQLTFSQIVARIEEEAEEERDFLFAGVIDVFKAEDIIVLKTLEGAAYEVAKKIKV